MYRISKLEIKISIKKTVYIKYFLGFLVTVGTTYKKNCFNFQLLAVKVQHFIHFQQQNKILQILRITFMKNATVYISH